jgi:hypothetical protein
MFFLGLCPREHHEKFSISPKKTPELIIFSIWESADRKSVTLEVPAVCG